MGILIFFRRRVIVTIERRMAQNYGTRLRNLWNAVLDLIPFRETKLCGQQVKYCTGVEESSILFYHAESYKDYIETNRQAIEKVLVQFRQLFGHKGQSIQDKDLETLLTTLWKQARNLSHQQVFQEMRESVMNMQTREARNYILGYLLEGVKSGEAQDNPKIKDYMLDCLVKAHESWKSEDLEDRARYSSKRKLVDNADEQVTKKTCLHEQ